MKKYMAFQTITEAYLFFVILEIYRVMFILDIYRFTSKS